MKTKAACLSVALLLLGLIRPASAQAMWQLTFTYSGKGLFLLRAAPIPALVKQVNAPGFNGATLLLDYDLEWLDDRARVLQVQPVVIPLGGHTVIRDDGVPDGSDLWVLPEDTFVVRVPGPVEPGIATQVRLVQRGAHPQVAADPALGSLRVPPAFKAEQTFALPAEALSAAPGPIAATKIQDTGSDGNRFVIVIMGDGFTEADLATGSFSNKANSFLTALFRTSPWDNYLNTVNAYRVDIVSTESGADYADAAPESGGTQKETYLNGGFWVGGTERCAYLRGSGVARATAAADDLVGVGVWDEILVFLNSTKYGGCGGALGVATLNSSSDQVQIHEFGHSFAHVGDEYDYGSTSTNCTPGSTPNIECGENFPLVKWQPWVTPGTPIPTPDTSQYNNVVGAFEGAGAQRYGKYRPMRDCKMRSLGAAFCPICKEAHVLRLFRQLRLADAAEPLLGPADVPSYGSRIFSITPLPVDGLTCQWFTNNVLVPGATNTSYVVAGNALAGTNEALRVELTHSTPLVRAEQILQSDSWTLRAAPQPTIWIADARVVEGDLGTANLVFPVWLSYAHTNTVSVRYATLNGTARAGEDYDATNGWLTFPPGQVAHSVQVVVHGDATTEGDEVLFVNLGHPTDAILGDAQGVGLILDRDQVPGVSITSPADNHAFSAPATIGISANAYDVDGFVSRVEFFANDASLGQVAEEPFSLTWSNVPVGNYLLTAIATDNSGKQAICEPVGVSVLAGGAQAFTLIELTNAWRYDATTNDYGPGWKDIGYSDSGWDGPSPAILYNEDSSIPGPRNTQIPLLYNGERIRSFYFRTHFLFPTSPPPGLLLVSSNLIDDGAVFWLNGAEAGRLRMPEGPVTRTALASSQPPSGDATNYDVINLPTTNLFPGDNVMAVEVHQQSTTSSDVVFGMALNALLGFAPVITDATQPTNQTVIQGRSTTLSVNVAASPVPDYQWFHNGWPLAGATGNSYTITSMTSDQAGEYSLRATNLLGAVTSRVAGVSYEADGTGPDLIYALGTANLTRITVTFSEPIYGPDAITATNYLVTSTAGSNLVVLVARYQNSTTVMLVTENRLPGVNYVLTVNNVRDVNGNPVTPDSTVAVATGVTLIAGDGHVWDFFQSDRDPGFGWPVPGFVADGSPWGTAPALFDATAPPGRASVGPNNEPVRTMLNLTNPPGADARTVTYYFRTTFNLPGPPAGARLRLRTLVDDGAVFYLNGYEVYRLRVAAPPAAIAYTNWATAVQGDSDNVYEGPFWLPTSALREGENVLAAEVHQANATSSDMSFAAELIGELPLLGYTPANLTIRPLTDGYDLSWECADAILEEASAVGGPWAAVTPAGSSPYHVPAEAGARFYRLRLPH